MMPFQTIARSALAGAIVFAAMPALAGEPTKREIREAKAILQSFFPASRAAGRCSIEPGWSTDGIPPELVRRNLGVKAKDYLKPPTPKATLQSLLDSDRVGPSAFCDLDAVKAYEKEQEALGAKEHFEVPRNAYTFPVFDKRHALAIVVTWDGAMYWLGLGGKLEPQGGEGSANAVIFRKTHGIWKVIDGVEVGRS